VDTTAFTGNFPERCRVEACGVPGYPSPAELATADWQTLVDWAPLAGDTHNLFPVASTSRYTHVRLVVSTDGGVARLRVNGRVVVDPVEVDGLTVDLAGRAFGGLVESSSDDFYSAAAVLNHPLPARHMGEGWETRRRRGSGNDHAVLRVASGEIRVVEVDTSYYVHNASKEFALSVSTATTAPPVDSDAWTPLIGRTRLQPDARQRFRVDAVPATFVRLDAYPDGGLSRLRVIGAIRGESRRVLGRAWFDSLPAAQACQVLADRCGVDGETARALTAARPLRPDALEALPERVRAMIDGRLPA
jgi:allantoicase